MLKSKNDMIVTTYFYFFFFYFFGYTPEGVDFVFP